ncbi:sulfatase-like hydrolase/transferase [Providencia rettgeri]|uniref:Sulfatase-like hydrolase/transferase n=1 Tax=Providencia rettgeri TaxID=587 RepID=A0A939NBN8_PRORE|nr:sulfatase-like hydrolase/transferase [Providencia rettgeri]
MQNSEAVDKLGLNLPTFERIKRSGVNFPNAFTAAPTCTASRISILTGKPIYQLEQRLISRYIILKIINIYRYLKDNGYYVGFSGKGWAPGKTEPGGRSQNPAGARYKNFDTFMAERPKTTILFLVR